MREFIEKMRERGLVVDVEEPVSVDMQAPKMAAATDKLLFFHKINGARAVMNLTASRTSLSLALGIDEKNIVKTLANAKFDGKVVVDGTLPTKKPDLARLPIMHHFPKDAGKYLTSGIVFSQSEGVENAAIHRMQVLDDHRVAARLVEGRHTHVMLGKALAKGEKLPIAVTIGTHPAVTFASCTRVPPGMEIWVCRRTPWRRDPGEEMQQRGAGTRRGDRAGRIYRCGRHRRRAVCGYYRDL